MSRHFLVCVLPGKAPLDAAFLSVPARLPSVDFGGEDGTIRQAPIKTLTIENADFYFSHIEPTGVLWSVVEDDTTQQGLRFLDPKNLLEAFSEVRIEVVQHKMNVARFGINVFEQVSNEGHEIRFGTTVGDRDSASPPLGSTATNRLQVPARTYS